MELTRGRYSRPQMSPWSLKIQGHPTSNRRFSHLESKSCSTVSRQFGCLSAVPAVPFAFCLNHVLGYVHPDLPIDYSSSLVIEFIRDVHNPDCVAEKSCPIRIGMGNQRLFG